MAFNGSGTFTLVAGNPVVTGTTISSTWANNTLSDMATGLSTCITKDGQTTPTANIPLGGFKLTGLGNPTGNGDALRFENIALMGASIQAQTYTAYTTGGSATAYTLTTVPAAAALAANQRYQVLFHLANTSTTPTLARDGLTAKALKVYSAGVKTDPAIGAFALNMLADVVYDGTDYVVLGQPTPATTSAAGVVELATTAEVKTGTSTTLVPSVAAMQDGKLVVETPQLTTSGTEWGYTTVPSWAKRITFEFVSFSTNGANNPLIQIGDSGGYETSGYLGSGIIAVSATALGGSNFTTGFGIASGAAGNILHGSIVLTLENAATFTWAASGVLALSNTAAVLLVSGTKSLSAALDRIRLTAGGDTGDGGSINITYE